MLTPGHEENDQRGPTSSVLNVSRSLAERAAAKVPMSLGSSGSFESSLDSGSCCSGGRIAANIHCPGHRRKRPIPRTKHQEAPYA